MPIACPSCGADVEFRSTQSVFAVCPYCRASLVRRDVNLEMIGKMSELRADLSPLQIGTTGKIDGKSFQIAGRLKIGWEKGFWLEWFALEDDGGQAWIAEAQGFWMISREKRQAARLPPLASLKPSSHVTFGVHPYVVGDIKKTTCLYSEGELPFPAPLGRAATSVDLAGPAATFASLDYSDEGEALYEGRYADFMDFHFQNLRTLDGW